jgi:2-amino-4-hydroxy-6-hydroxymethyldihydropteridine diphosphokinase
MMDDPARARRWERAFVGLGSNVGDRSAQIERALEWMTAHASIELVSRTELIETPPWGVTDQPMFLNAVVEISTRLEPRELLAELKRCEAMLGRDLERGPRWGPREIDLDILLYGALVIDTPQLTIPHPRLTERTFVLAQLGDLDPGLVHPGSGLLLSSYLRDT